MQIKLGNKYLDLPELMLLARNGFFVQNIVQMERHKARLVAKGFSQIPIRVIY